MAEKNFLDAMNTKLKADQERKLGKSAAFKTYSSDNGSVSKRIDLGYKPSMISNKDDLTRRLVSARRTLESINNHSSISQLGASHDHYKESSTSNPNFKDLKSNDTALPIDEATRSMSAGSSDSRVFTNKPQPCHRLKEFIDTGHHNEKETKKIISNMRYLDRVSSSKVS